MLKLIKEFFTPPTFEGNEEKTRSAEILNAVLNSTYITFILLLIALSTGGTPKSTTYIVIGLLFLMLTLHFFLKKGYVQPVGILLIVFLTLSLTIIIASNGTISSVTVSFYIVTSVISALVISTQAMYWSTGTNIILIFLITWAEDTGKLPEVATPPGIQLAVVFAAASIISAILLSLALNRLEKVLSHARHEKELILEKVSLEQQVEERTEKLEKQSAYLKSSVEINRTVASITNTSELIEKVINLIQEDFSLYYVGIFLIDEENKWAVLKAGTGEAGKIMLNNKHHLKIGAGLIGWSIKHAQARIALDVGKDAAHFDNPVLPETRSEAALPLRSRGRVLGALSIQSRQQSAFDQDFINTLQTMTDQIAIALDNAELFAQSERILQAERKAYGQLSQDDWHTLLQRKKVLTYTSDAPNSVRALEDVIEISKEIENSSEDNGLTAIIPIKIHGHALGGLKLRKNQEQGGWTEEELELAKILAEQASISLESARLFDQSQRRATRERVISQASSRMRETLNIESVLAVAAQEFRDSLGMAEAEVWINAEDTSKQTK